MFLLHRLQWEQPQETDVLGHAWNDACLIGQFLISTGIKKNFKDI